MRLSLLYDSNASLTHMSSVCFKLLVVQSWLIFLAIIELSLTNLNFNCLAHIFLSHFPWILFLILHIRIPRKDQSPVEYKFFHLLLTWADSAKATAANFLAKFFALLGKSLGTGHMLPLVLAIERFVLQPQLSANLIEFSKDSLRHASCLEKFFPGAGGWGKSKSNHF